MGKLIDLHHFAKSKMFLETVALFLIKSLNTHKEKSKNQMFKNANWKVEFNINIKIQPIL